MSGADFNHLIEGWAADAPGSRTRKDARGRSIATYHYFAGLGGLGGRFRSLCNTQTTDHRTVLLADVPSSHGFKVCRECLLRVARANAHSRPSGRDF